MQLIFGRDTDEAFVEGGSREFDGGTFTEEDEERSWLLGLGYSRSAGRAAASDSAPASACARPPSPTCRRATGTRRMVTELLLLRARQTVFWESEDGFGTATRVSLEHMLREDRMLRWANNLRISEATDGMRWNTNLTLYQSLATLAQSRCGARCEARPAAR